MHALENHYNTDMLVFMIQREVAERMVATPDSKAYGALTLGIGYHCRAEMVTRVPKKVFIPQPEVESTVVRLIKRAAPPAPVDDEETFFAVVRAAFGQRRKTLGNALTGVAGYDKAAITRILGDCGLDPGRRGETLSFAEFALVANTLFAGND